MKITGKFRVLKKSVIQKEGKPSYTFIEAGDTENFDKVTFSVVGKEVTQNEGEDINLVNINCVVRAGKYCPIIQLNP